MSTFEQFNLPKSVQKAIDELGFTTPTPIQEKSFSVIMSGRDMMGIAQTGTGKTFAYLLPLLKLYKFTTTNTPKIVILVPTRELVVQVVEEVEKLTKYMSVSTLGIYGGVNINTQKKDVYEGVDILVGTPGRTMDLALDAVVRFDETQKLVIDEFDEIAPAREFRPSSAGVVNELLKSIPEFRRRPGRLLICATNFVESIDPAVLRPGRFDLLIGIGPPDQTALTALWQQAVAPMNKESDVDPARLAAESHGFTPGDVDLAAQRAAAAAFSRSCADGSTALVTVEDLLTATRRTRASITPTMLEAFTDEVSRFERV